MPNGPVTRSQFNSILGIPGPAGPPGPQGPAGASGGSNPLGPNATWTVSDWYFKPITGDDTADGKSPSTAFKTKAALAAAWGTVEPILAQNTTLHFIETQSVNADPGILRPIMRGAYLLIEAGAPAVIAAGVHLTGVVVANFDNNNQPLQVNLAGHAGYPRGTMLQNTTIGKESRAFIWDDFGGGNYPVTQPVTLQTPTSPGGGTVVWANGDTVNVLQPLSVELTEIRPRVETSPGGVSPVFVYQIAVGGGSPSSGYFENVSFVECFMQTNVTSEREFNGGAASVQFWNCWQDQSVSAHSAEFFAGAISAGANLFGFSQIETGALLSGVNVKESGILNLNGNVCFQGNVLVRGGNIRCDASGLLFGSGNILLERARFSIPVGQTFTACLNTAAMTGTGIDMDGVSQGVKYVTGGGTLTTPIATTPANLDAAVAADRNGMFNFVGSCINALDFQIP